MKSKQKGHNMCSERTTILSHNPEFNCKHEFTTEKFKGIFGREKLKIYCKKCGWSR